MHFDRQRVEVPTGHERPVHDDVERRLGALAGEQGQRQHRNQTRGHGENVHHGAHSRPGREADQRFGLPATGTPGSVFGSLGDGAAARSAFNKSISVRSPGAVTSSAHS